MNVTQEETTAKALQNLEFVSRSLKASLVIAVAFGLAQLSLVFAFT